MLRTFIALALLLLAACDDQDKEASRKVVTLTTEAGQTFHFMPIYEDGVSDVTFRFAWPTNWSRTEGLNPATPFIGSELILVGGTEDKKPQELVEFYNERNVRGSLLASMDHVFGEIEMPKEYLDEVMPIAAELLSNPQLDSNWMNRIKQGLAENQKQAQIASSYKLWNAARMAMMGDTPLYRTLGLLDINVITDVTRDDILEWHADTFTQTDVTISVTGAISPEDASRFIDMLMTKLPEGTPKPEIVDVVDFSPKTILLHLPEAEKTTIGFAGALPLLTEDGDAMDFYGVNLLGDANGPLFEAIRTELRATYGMSAGVADFSRFVRAFVIQGEVETAQLAQVRDVTLAAYEEFRTSKEFTGFDELKTRVVAGTAENVRYVNVAARTMLELALFGKDPALTPKLHTLFDAVTKESLSTHLSTKFPPADTLMVFAVSPDANALPGACVITKVEDAATCN